MKGSNWQISRRSVSYSCSVETFEICQILSTHSHKIALIIVTYHLPAYEQHGLVAG
jgi:hypothetical protein